MTVTELLTRTNSTPIPVAPDRDGQFTFPPGLGTGDPFLDGVQLHAGLRLLRFNRPRVSPRHKRLWPVLTAVREAARRLGAERLFPEVTIRRAGLTGRVDLRADGARGLGHIEVKVVANLPDAPRQRDLHQASLYLALTNGRPPAWAALIYVSMLSGEARYFVFSDALTSLMKSTSVFPVRNRLGR